MEDNEKIHIESMLYLSRKIKRGLFKGLCENTTPEKIGIEKGDMPKVDDARVPV